MKPNDSNLLTSSIAAVVVLSLVVQKESQISAGKYDFGEFPVPFGLYA